MRTTISFLLTLLLSLPLIAQENSLTGTVYNEQDQAVPYANVLLSVVEDSSSTGAADPEIIMGTSTDEQGRFKFEQLKSATYKIKITFLGYETYKKNISLSEDLHLEYIQLKEASETLDTIVLETPRPTLSKEVDRLIFNIDQTALSEGTMLEVLRSTPGVLVLGNSISVKNVTPTVYINDRKVHLSPGELTQLLEGTPANSVRKIEVITNPPAKYDASSGAVINIVMSRNLVTGYRGQLFSNYTQGVFPRYNAGVNQFYKAKNINLNLNYSFTQSKINRDNEEHINYLNNGVITEKWLTHLNRNTTSKTHHFNFNFDYFVTERSTLSVSSTLLLLPFFNYSTNGNTEIRNGADVLDTHFNSHNLSRDNKNNLGFDIDFVHRFKNKGKLSINTHVTAYDYKRNQMVNSEYFPVSAPNSSTAFRTNNNQTTDIYTSQIDYEIPLSESATFSAGIKSSQVNTKSDITQFDIDLNTNTSILNAANTDAYDYDEGIYAVYASYDKSWKKWNFSGGLRAEQTVAEGRSIEANQINSQKYLQLYPTLNLSVDLSDKTMLYTNYKRSVERPNFKDLNPFNFFLNDNTIVAGNPTLQPSFLDHFVLGTTINDAYTIEAYYIKTKASFFELPIQNNTDNIIVYTPTNLNRTQEYGLDFITSFNLNDRWFVYFLTSFYNRGDEAYIDNVYTKFDQWSNLSVLSNDFSFLKDKSLTANLSMTYVGKNQQGFRKSEAILVSDLSVKKTLFKKKAIISLAASNLFNTQDYDVSFKFNTQDNHLITALDNRYIKLGFSYKFGNTTLKTNQRTKNRTERLRL